MSITCRPSGVPKYIVGDVAWPGVPTSTWNCRSWRNLGNGKFYEFGNDNILGAVATEVVPEVYAQVAWRY